MKKLVAIIYLSLCALAVIGGLIAGLILFPGTKAVFLCSIGMVAGIGGIVFSINWALEQL